MLREERWESMTSKIVSIDGKLFFFLSFSFLYTFHRVSYTNISSFFQSCTKKTRTIQRRLSQWDKEVSARELLRISLDILWIIGFAFKVQQIIYTQVNFGLLDSLMMGPSVSVRSISQIINHATLSKKGWQS